MDLSEFKEEFIDEAKNQLESIDRQIVVLDDGFSEEKMLDLKRGFHTLKGNAATMGYNKYFELAKALNDLCQALIDNKVEFRPDVLLVFRDGREKLLYALDFIDQGKSEEFDDEDLAVKVNSMLD